MKSISKFFFLGAFISFRILAGTPIDTLINIEHIYVPKGFDSNDNTEIIVEGKLPNLCHKAPTTKVEFEAGKINVTVTALKYSESNPFCVPVEVPFVEAVNVGVLEKGFYDIVVNGKSIYEKSSEIFISESTSSAIDDYIYANVSYVDDKSSDGRKVKLVGYNPSDCLEFQGVDFVDNKKDVVAVLPKMKRVFEHCPMKMVPFEHEIEVPKLLKRDKVLLHVRAMNGKSVNTVFDNKKE